MISIADNYTPREGSGWRTDIVLNPAEGHVEIYTFFGGGQPMRTYLGTDVVLATFPGAGFAEAQGFVDFLGTEYAQDVLGEIVAGHSIRWDGSNHVGRLTAEAARLVDQIGRDLEDVAEQMPTFWAASEFWGGAGFAGESFWEEEGGNIQDAGSIAAWVEAEVRRHKPRYQLDAKDVENYVVEQLLDCVEDRIFDKEVVLRLLEKARA